MRGGASGRAQSHLRAEIAEWPRPRIFATLRADTPWKSKCIARRFSSPVINRVFPPGADSSCTSWSWSCCTATGATRAAG